MRFLLLYLFLIAFAMIPTQLSAQDSTYAGHSGYIRSGFGLDGQGNALDVFKAPNAMAKYRLGNEAEAYAETRLFVGKQDERGAIFETNMLLAFVAPTSSSNSFETTISLREAYVKASGVFAKKKGLSLWAGQRYYDRLEIYLNDFWPRDLTGFGGGFEGLELGSFAKLALALLGGSIDKLNPDGTVRPENEFAFNKSTIDLNFYDIGLGPGKLSFFIGLSQFSGDELQTSEGDYEILSDFAWSTGLIHEIPFDKGRNLAHLFYGTGAAHDGWAIITQPTGVEYEAGVPYDPSGIRRFRAIEDLRVDFNKRFSMLGLLMYQYLDNNMPANNILHWYSAGLRPILYLNRYFSLVSEFGWDYTSQLGGDQGSLFKATLAPSVMPFNKLLSRPVLRAYFTYATWSEAFRGQVAPTSFPDATRGISFGLQMEVWW